jgi:HEAT repeat protein
MDGALSQLLALKCEDSARIRTRVAHALKHFDTPEAKAALAELRSDTDHTVVGAAMEPMLGY